MVAQFDTILHFEEQKDSKRAPTTRKIKISRVTSKAYTCQSYNHKHTLQDIESKHVSIYQCAILTLVMLVFNHQH